MKTLLKAWFTRAADKLRHALLAQDYSIRRIVGVSPLRRPAAMLVLTALLLPLVFFGQLPRTSAQTASPIVNPVPAPAAVSPKAFASTLSEPGFSAILGSVVSLSFVATNDKLANSYESAANFITPPAPPRGFENAVLATIGNRISASFSSLTRPLFADAPAKNTAVAPTAVKSKTVNKINRAPDKNAADNHDETSAIAEDNQANETMNDDNSEAEGNLNGELSAPVLMPVGCQAFGTHFDFDGDGCADVSRFQPSSNQWKVKNSSTGSLTTATFGTAGAVLAPADYDGDGKTDRAVFSAGTWTITKSSNGQTQAISGFGQSGDKIVSGNYDNDSSKTAELAVWRPSSGTWYTYRLSDGQTTAVQWGASGDVPVPGDYDGNGSTDLAVFRPSTNTWYVMLPGNGGSYTYFQWGDGTDIPVPADYDGDGRTDYAVYRPSNGTWYVQPINNTAYLSKTWGNYGDQPVPADYDGDGKADFAVWRPTSGVWYIVKSSVAGSTTYVYDQLGIPSDVAVPSAYVKQIGGAILSYDLANARLSPKNATGGTNLYSRNFNWGTSLVNLPGRAGLDAGFGLSYNSLVWTKEPTSNTMVFDADHSNITPGFRFGFPTIEPSYYNGLTQQYSYLMVTPAGSRVEFRQNAASNVYETADSSYSQLTVIAPAVVGGGGTGHQTPPPPSAEDLTLLVRTTDGTMMTYLWRAGAYRLSEIKDRNGNFITVVYDSDYGLLRSMTDTLGRVVTVEYDADFCPTAIKQDWKDNNGAGAGVVSHTYASFYYTTKQITPNFKPDLNMNIFGPSNGAYVKVLEQIVYPTGRRTVFEYNDYGQVKKVNNLAADLTPLNYVETNLADYVNSTATPDDGPRLAETRNWVKDFNNNQPTVIHNTFTSGATYTAGGESLSPTDVTEVWMDVAGQTGIADVHSKTYYYAAGNWAEGLPLGTRDFADGVQKRWTRTMWKQDDETKIYKVNPRVIESKVGDTTNTKLTTMNYQMQPGSTTASQFGLVNEVRIFDTDQTTVLKKAVTTYQMDAAYIDRRIIGLPLEQQLYQGESTPMSRVSYEYDQGDFTGEGQNISSSNPVIQHDNTGFGASFTSGRGNATSTTRYDVTGQTTAVTSLTKYNTAGAAVSQTDPLGRTVTVSYADTFNDGGNSRNTFAYPTRLTEVANTDTSNNYSTIKYRFDTGANVWAKSPSPPVSTSNTSGVGKISERIFDAVGRLERERIIKGGTEYSYVRHVYPTNQVQSQVYTTITAGAGEVLSENWSDGAGRTIKSKTELPNAGNGHYSGSLVEYDILGRVKRASAPMEITVGSNGVWTPAGDDANYGGWLWNSTEYDWKGRPTRKINSDGTDKTISYEGCGCAGGQITTVQGEEIIETDWQGNNPVSLGRRTQKIYADILGRTVKTQLLDFNGASVYQTVDTVYNGRDQAMSLTRTGSGTAIAQVTTMTYDGHGRLKTQHRPEQDVNTATVYNYNADDRIESVVDARGASTSYAYNNRGLVEQISYARPSGNTTMRIPATVNFTYDALDNRTQMTETTNPAAGGISGLGNTTYAYDSLSRLTSETRTINDTATGFNQSFTFNYEYNQAGQLTNFSDPNDQERAVTYERDKIGRVISVKNPLATRFNNVEDYATNIQYRAFGAVKSLTYGTANIGKQLTQTFNNRLQLDQFNVSGGNSTSGDNLGSTNKYYADGSIKAAADTYNNKFDRTYQYDYAGRIREAKTGSTARDPQNGGYDSPYQQSFGYNSFGNLTGRTGFNWGDELASMTATYANNRNTAQYWIYDADGRNTATEEIYSYFDAAGRRYHTSTNLEIEQTFDGNGQLIKQTEDNGSGVNTKKRYYVQSSILGKVYEIQNYNSSWVKTTGIVYLNGQQIAIQNLSPNNTTQKVWWIYENPATGAMRGTTSKLASEPDPLGVNHGTTAPPPTPPDYGDGGSVPDFILPHNIVDPSNFTNGCQWGGLPVSCDQAPDLASIENQATGGLGSGVTSGNSWGLDNMQQTTENTANTALATSHLGGESLDPRSNFGGSLNAQVAIWNQGTGFEEYVNTPDGHGGFYPVPTAHAGTGYFTTSANQQEKPHLPAADDFKGAPVIRRSDFNGSGSGRGLFEALLGARLSDAINAGLPSPCLAALNALGISTTQLLDAFDRAEFVTDPSFVSDPSKPGARTDFNSGSTAFTITSQTGVQVFSDEPIGFAIHELSHGQARRSDSGIYNIIAPKVTGLPAVPVNATETDYSHALTDFFNAACGQ